MFFVLKKLGNFDRFFSNLGKTRENLKVDGEVCSRNNDKFSFD